MSIGSLSQATNIPVGTLRSWEHRYGFPQPTRLESGHRRYALRDVERLRAIKLALDLGNRPSAIVSAPLEVLRQLLNTAPTAPRPPDADLGDHVDRFMAATLQLKESAFDRALERAVDELGVHRFMREAVLPFLRAVGAGWVDGKIGVMHEHFASDRLKAMIDRRRRAHDSGATVVCATLPGERHDLGLHIGALLLSYAGLRVVFLGADMPLEEIGGAATQSEAAAVLIGSSSAADLRVLLPQLASLRRLLPSAVPIGIGGTTRAPEGVDLLEDFDALDDWANTRINTDLYD